MEDPRDKLIDFILGARRASPLKAPVPESACLLTDDIDWVEVAAGLWPEEKTAQLLAHASVCTGCGPMLRAAASVDDAPTPEEQALLAQLAPPRRPVSRSPVPAVRHIPETTHGWRQILRWMTPAVAVAALAICVGLLVVSSRSRSSLTGPAYGEFAVRAHLQHARGELGLDLRSDSQSALNAWFKSHLPFALTLPASPSLPGEERPFRLEGARLVTVSGQPAAFVAYKLQRGAASLVVAPDSLVVASGGTQVTFKKVSFHYATLDGRRVVTWTQHGLTYALVSDEPAATQQSCMVCHSAMRDRDFSHTPAPAPRHGYLLQPFL
jgi:hypothetical protein